jgi:arylformamidase
MSWKSLSSEKIWDEYNIVVPDAQEINEEYQRSSAEIVSQQSSHVDISYDIGGERQSLDLFTPNTESPSPILVFVHGGYWKVNSKNLRRFPAQAYAGNGIAWAPINYRLAPEFSIDEIVHDGRNAIAWLYRNAKNFNCDPNKIYVAGNSAGGHMVAMLCAHGWQSGYDVPDEVVKGGCALSGLFDLEPLLQAEANEWLKMDTETARRNSPSPHPIFSTC